MASRKGRQFLTHLLAALLAAAAALVVLATGVAGRVAGGAAAVPARGPLLLAAAAACVVGVLAALVLGLGGAAGPGRVASRLAARCREIAGGSPGGTVEASGASELTGLVEAFNDMSQRLAEQRDETRATMAQLKDARDQLEAHLSEHTARLGELRAQVHFEAAERKRVEDALAKANTTDYLTGLLNRRAMMQLLEQEVKRFARSKKPFSILLGDVDHFKQVNEAHGEQVGDHALVYLSRLLRQRVRGQDAIARWGGEEVLIFLPETPLRGAVDVAEKIRQELDEYLHSVDGVDVRLTLSVGVSSIAPGMTVNECVRRADVALARAKAEGRNRTIFLE
jgi:diguanylate cyclase (GGDEF)-like protein